jgi:salicylate hydroxylase
VTVLEGAPSFGAIGYGIQFGPNVFHVLDRIGVSDAVLEKADFPPALLMIDALNGKEVTRVPTGASFRARFKYPYIIIHRIDLHNAMLDACRRDPLVTLVPDAMVSRFSDQGDRVTNVWSGRALQEDFSEWGICGLLIPVVGVCTGRLRSPRTRRPRPAARAAGDAQGDAREPAA